jgi:hypothetical protein
MAKVRSLRYIKREIEKVEASIRKHAKSSKVAKRKKEVLNVLEKMKTTLASKCGDPSFSPMDPEEGATTAARKTVAKKGA